MMKMLLKNIKPYPDNPRIISDQAIEQVKRSIDRFGFLQPIVIDNSNVIIVGHTRYLAAQKLKMESVWVEKATKLSPDECDAYRIADNKTSELSAWHSDGLIKEVYKLKDFDFDDNLKIPSMMNKQQTNAPRTNKTSSGWSSMYAETALQKPNKTLMNTSQNTNKLVQSAVDRFHFLFDVYDEICVSYNHYPCKGFRDGEI